MSCGKLAICEIYLEEGRRMSKRVVACFRLWDAVCKVMMCQAVVSTTPMGWENVLVLIVTATLSLVRIVRFERMWGEGKMSSKTERKWD